MAYPKGGGLRIRAPSLEDVISDAKAARLTVAATVMLAILPLSAAEATDTYHFKDILRHHGHARGMSAKLADGRSCGASGSSFFEDVKKFEQCMRAHGWVVDRYVPDPKSRVVAGKRSSTYIDPDTGMSCRNVGGIAICDPPHGTVRYFDPEQGLNCQRKGS